jgi:hypothetical protein
VKNYLKDQRDKANAAMRNPGPPLLSLDALIAVDGESAERQYRFEPGHDATPERIYHRRWALLILDRAFERLRAQEEREGEPRRSPCVRCRENRAQRRRRTARRPRRDRDASRARWSRRRPLRGPIAPRNACFALEAGGREPARGGPRCQGDVARCCACDVLKSSSDQRIGSQRSASGAA